MQSDPVGSAECCGSPQLETRMDKITQLGAVEPNLSADDLLRIIQSCIRTRKSRKIM